MITTPAGRGRASSICPGKAVPLLASNVPSDFALRHPLPNTGIIQTELRDSRLFCTEWADLARFE
jgi:hypothetical protein